jgi:hypothetical protein
VLRHHVHKLIDDLCDLRRALVEDRIPPEVREHCRNVRREALLGIRALVDGALARLEAQEARRQSVTIPVEGD